MESKSFVPKWPIMVMLAGPGMIVFGVFTFASYLQGPPEVRSTLYWLGALVLVVGGVYLVLLTVLRVDFAHDRLIIVHRLHRREVAYSEITDVSAYGFRSRRGGLYMTRLANATEFAQIMQDLVSSGKINPYQLDGKLRTDEARLPTVAIGGLVVGALLWVILSSTGVLSSLGPEWVKHSLEGCVVVGMFVVAMYFWLRDRLTLG